MKNIKAIASAIETRKSRTLLLAVAAVAALAGSVAHAGELGGVHSRELLEFQSRHWNGNDIPADLVAFNRPVRSAGAAGAFGRDAFAGTAAAPVRADVGVNSRSGRDTQAGVEVNRRESRSGAAPAAYRFGRA